MVVSENGERRKTSRVSFATQIKIILEMEGKTFDVEGDSKDLSLKGIFVNIKESFELGTGCQIKVLLTGSVDRIELQMQGRIVRKTENGVGIVFDSMDVDSYSHLKNIVRYNSFDEA